MLLRCLRAAASAAGPVSRRLAGRGAGVPRAVLPAAPRLVLSAVRCCHGAAPPEPPAGRPLARVQARLALAFTCKVCDTRVQKVISRLSYERGVVIVECDGCRSRHLIADHLGWFADVQGRTVEEILAQKGETVTRIGSVEVPPPAGEEEADTSTGPQRDSDAVAPPLRDS